ncbi:MAG: NAD-dependent epimerase/dehydratase family protein [Planctomycetaceae bacterium]
MSEAERVLVTGGAGFIGSHIVDQLIAAGHQAVALDDLSSGSRDNLPAGVPLHVVDIRDCAKVREVFEQVRPTAVCHQAAQMSVSRSVREPGFDAEANILGLIHVLDSAAHVGVRHFAFASSGGVLYGDVTTPATEDVPAAPVSPYGISKWAGERYLEFFSREHGVRCVALRYSNVYGPRQNPHGEAGVVAIFCTKLLAGEPATINGDGRYIRDYVYVADVARANYLALTAEIPSPFMPLNIGTGVATDVNQLEASLRHECQRTTGRRAPEPRHGPPRAGDLRSNLLSAQRAAAILGWKPLTPVADGLRQTFEWFAGRKNQS